MIQISTFAIIKYEKKWILIGYEFGHETIEIDHQQLNPK